MKMVHCISAGAPAADGSEKQVTQFVDGFQAAQQMKHEHPEQFRLLTSVKMDFFDGAHNAITMARHPTIKYLYVILPNVNSCSTVNSCAAECLPCVWVSVPVPD